MRTTIWLEDDWYVGFLDLPYVRPCFLSQSVSLNLTTGGGASLSLHN